MEVLDDRRRHDCALQVLSKPESLPPQAPAQGEANQHVGFWRNPKRFNVAITRAQALLVVVGHPVVLMEVCALCFHLYIRGRYPCRP